MEGVKVAVGSRVRTAGAAQQYAKDRKESSSLVNMQMPEYVDAAMLLGPLYLSLGQPSPLEIGGLLPAGCGAGAIITCWVWVWGHYHLLGVGPSVG